MRSRWNSVIELLFAAIQKEDFREDYRERGQNLDHFERRLPFWRDGGDFGGLPRRYRFFSHGTFGRWNVALKGATYLFRENRGCVPVEHVCRVLRINPR